MHLSNILFYHNITSKFLSIKDTLCYFSTCCVYFGLYIYVSEGLPCWLNGKESTCNSGDTVQFLGWEDPLEKKMAVHFSILAWEIPQTGWQAIIRGATKESDTTQ